MSYFEVLRIRRLKWVATKTFPTTRRLYIQCWAMASHVKSQITRITDKHAVLKFNNDAPLYLCKPYTSFDKVKF